MDKATYQQLQYLTLRKEIEDCLQRAFQIMVGGATLIPVLVGIVGHYSATPILIALPMMVVVTALLYLNQWNMIMRCGRYIRTKIEPSIMGDEGWEAWLESPADTEMGAVHNRLVDTYLAYAFYVLIGAYYFGTSYVGVIYAYQSYGAVGEWATLGVYIVIGILMAFIVIRRVPTNTTTKKERSLTWQQVALQPLPDNKDASTVDASTSDTTGASPSVLQLDESTPPRPSENRPAQS